MAKFIRDILHRASQHAHEIVVALVVEGSRASIFFVALLVAAILVAFAFQQLLRLED